jgi:DNA-binding response OmpR family regulator
MRVLLVEDDLELVSALSKELKATGFVVDCAADGIEAEFLGDEEPYDAIVLDLGLPGKPGLAVLAAWRAKGKRTPVLILTARDTWRERVDGLKAGADDYLGKPFHIEELLARIDALIRRNAGQVTRFLEAPGLRLDEDHQAVLREDDSAIELTGTEFRLLRYFMRNPGKILSKTRLTEHVYDQGFDRDSNVIEVYVRRLRERIGKERIITQRGQGYIFK